jgi:hypothetical protein
MQPSSNLYVSNFSTITSAPAPTPKRRHPLQQIKLAISQVFSKFVVDDPIKRAYLRTSLLFALSVLATWIPSSMNRIHSWLLGNSPFEYHVATAAVLPLQGLWNAVIFFVTSSHALRETWRHRHDEPGQVQQQLTGDMADTGVVDRLGSTEMGGGIEGNSFLDDSESGSDVELRRMAEAPGKRSASM